MATTKRYRLRVPAQLYFDVEASSAKEAKRMASRASDKFNRWEYLAEVHLDLDSHEAEQMRANGIVFPASGPCAVVYADYASPEQVAIADEGEL